ncbi:hypothetical protein IP88_08295, partial [alpha proteobacterium AAP81b]
MVIAGTTFVGFAVTSLLQPVAVSHDDALPPVAPPAPVANDVAEAVDGIPEDLFNNAMGLPPEDATPVVPEAPLAPDALPPEALTPDAIAPEDASPPTPAFAGAATAGPPAGATSRPTVAAPRDTTAVVS